MEKREGYANFFAFTDDNQIYHFTASLNDKVIYWQEFGDEPFRKIHLEPDFKIMKDNMDVLSFCEVTNNVNSENLISNILISEILLRNLVDRGMLSYTKETAKLFGLDPEYAIENHYVEANMGKRRLLSRKLDKIIVSMYK